MPCAALGIDALVRRFGEHAVHRAAILRRGCPVYGCPQERVAEPDASPDLDNARRLRLPRCLRRNPQEVGDSPEQGHITDRVGRCRQKEALGRGRQGLQAAHEACLDLLQDGLPLGQRQPAGQVGRGQAPGQLEQCQGVAPRLRHDSVPDPLVEATRRHRVEQGAGVDLVQARDLELRQPREVVLAGRVPDREHQKDPLREQAPRDERQRLRGDAVKPLRVVHEADERAFFRHVGEQAEHGQPDEKAVRWSAGRQAECRSERVALGGRQSIEAVQEGGAELMQSPEGELHLGLDA